MKQWTSTCFFLRLTRAQKHLVGVSCNVRILFWPVLMSIEFREGETNKLYNITGPLSLGTNTLIPSNTYNTCCTRTAYESSLQQAWNQILPVITCFCGCVRVRKSIARNHEWKYFLLSFIRHSLYIGSLGLLFIPFHSLFFLVVQFLLILCRCELFMFNSCYALLECRTCEYCGFDFLSLLTNIIC